MWLPSFLYSHTSPLAHQAPVDRPSSISVGTPRLLAFIALANVVLGAALLYLGFGPDVYYPVAFVVFQFWPIVSPWIWPVVTVGTTPPSSVKDAVAASVTATQLYYAFAVLLLLHYWVGFVLPVATSPGKTPLDALGTLFSFLKQFPQEMHALPQWFLIVDAISLTATSALIVASEQRTAATAITSGFVFIAQAVLLGPGGAFMLFCASREQAIRRVHYVTPQKLSPWVQVHRNTLKEIVTVLKFDVHGNATMLRMRRADVLKMTQQAAAALGGSPHAAKQPSDGTPVDPIRSVIMRDCCLMFVPDTNHALVDLLKQNFHDTHGEDDDNQMAFEFRFLANDFERMAPIVNSSLERLASAQMSSGELETLRTLKNAMNEFESQVNGLRRVLMEILDNEVDLHLLYLTQSLLEVYLQDIHNTKTKVALMLHRIQNTESVVMLKMDAVRNYLLTADMLFTLIMVCMTFGMFVTAAFGMNLTSGLEQTQGAFVAVLAITVLCAVVSVYVGIAFFRKRGVII
ncbi:hypothetical protein DYB37_007612 [Aphanomyces astaci]|uniref:Magnesium transporter n=1 Tax=Aphanomyces astaci TaxID=112090 RepID=A0A3R6WUU1_APHAT|nr:hypothetical protein DYB35_012804 [Aphanomyces astaci]RHZ25411.1 hypothetical protein DYB37_007612 [Aphanomyces astaci]